MSTTYYSLNGIGIRPNSIPDFRTTASDGDLSAHLLAGKNFQRAMKRHLLGVVRRNVAANHNHSFHFMNRKITNPTVSGRLDTRGNQLGQGLASLYRGVHVIVSA